MAVEMRALATFTVHQADPSCHISVLCFVHGPTALHWIAREPPCVITSRRNEIYQSFVPVWVEVLHRERVKLYICLDGEQSKEEETGGWVCCHQHGIVASIPIMTSQRDDVLLVHILGQKWSKSIEKWTSVCAKYKILVEESKQSEFCTIPEL